MAFNYKTDSPFGERSLFADNNEPEIKGFANVEIDYQRLIDYIKQNVEARNTNASFKYQNFEGFVDEDISLGMEVYSTSKQGTVPYKNQNNKNVKLEARLGAAEGGINFLQGLTGVFEFALNKHTKYTIWYKYNTSMFKNNLDEIAIELTFFNYNDYYQTLNNYIYVSGTSILEPLSKETISKRFAEGFAAAGTNGEIVNWLYEKAPDFVIQQRGDAQLWEDLQILFKYDKSSWFSDAGSAILNILKAFNNLESLYKKLNQNPETVIAIYDVLNGKQAEMFCTFLDVLCKAFCSKERQATSSTKIPIGKGLTIDSDLFIKKGSKTVNLSVYETVDDGYTDVMILTHETHTQTVFKENQFHPLDMVQLYNLDTGETQIVPAIYVKSLSDKAEWATIVEIIQITFDIISILVSAGAIAAGAKGLMYIIAIADIGLAATDLALMSDEVKAALSQTVAGKWFVDNWAAIYGVAGVAMLTPMVVNGIVKNGPSTVAHLLQQGKNAPQNFINFVENLIVKIKVELYFASANKILLVGFEPFTIVVKLFGDKLAKGFRAAGLSLIEEVGKGSRQFVYKGVTIAEGDAKILKKKLDEIIKKGGKDVNEYLDKLTGLYKLEERLLSHSKLLTKYGREFLDELAKHIKGSVKLKEVSKNSKGQPIYQKSGIGGHSFEEITYGNARIKEGTVTIPPNPSIDEAFIARIEFKDPTNAKNYVSKSNSTIKINGKTRADASSMYPKNWNIQRIEEEVAFAYENKILITESIGLKGELIEKFIGKSTTGLEIEFVFNNKVWTTHNPIVKF